MQVLCVALILPQDRALVTKTFSQRKDGFSYGCLVAGVRGLSEDKSFVVIRLHPIFYLLPVYCNADCDTCIAHPPVPVEVVQVWLVCVEKYTWDAPARVPAGTSLSIITPLVPPAAAALKVATGPTIRQLTVLSVVVPAIVLLQVGGP
jgi:hypothetical protein